MLLRYDQIREHYLTRLSVQGFNVCQAATLSPLFFLNPAILSRAALYTAGVVGSLSYVGATASYVSVCNVSNIAILTDIDFQGMINICIWVGLFSRA